MSNVIVRWKYFKGISSFEMNILIRRDVAWGIFKLSAYFFLQFKVLIKYGFPLSFLHELLMSLRICNKILCFSTTRSFTQCLVKFPSAKCPDPSRSTNARVIGRQFYNGQQVEFVCAGDSSLTPQKSRKLTCLDGNWNGVIPVCKGIRNIDIILPSNRTL